MFRRDRSPSPTVGRASTVDRASSVGRSRRRLGAVAATALVAAVAMSGWVLPGLSLLGTALVAAPTLAMAAMAVPLLGSADAENRTECERFVLLTAGAGHLLVLVWGLLLVLRGLG